MKQPFRSRVYTDRPDYADFEPAAKFQAIESIIAKHLRAHPKAICSYSGGADSDIMIDLVERTRALFDLPPVQYVFFDTGLEMKATKAAWNIFGKSYEYRAKYNEYKARRDAEKKAAEEEARQKAEYDEIEGQMSIEDFLTAN